MMCRNINFDIGGGYCVWRGSLRLIECKEEFHGEKKNAN